MKKNVLDESNAIDWKNKMKHDPFKTVSYSALFLQELIGVFL